MFCHVLLRQEEIAATINADMGGTRMRAMGEIAPVTSRSPSFGCVESRHGISLCNSIISAYHITVLLTKSFEEQSHQEMV